MNKNNLGKDLLKEHGFTRTITKSKESKMKEREKRKSTEELAAKGIMINGAGEVEIDSDAGEQRPVDIDSDDNSSRASNLR